MFLALIVIYVLVFMTSAARASVREGYWSPIVVFGITAFYYYLSLPLELYLRGEEVFTTHPAMLGISPMVRTEIALSAVLALLGFVVGHHCSGMGRLIAESQRTATTRVPRSTQFLAVAAILLLFVLYRSSFSEKLSYDDNNERRFSDPVFGYLVRLGVLCSCLCMGILAQRKGWSRAPAALIAIAVAGWGCYTADKNPLLKSALGLSAFFIGKRSRSVKHLYLYCGAAVVAVGALPLFSAYRANAALDFRKSVTEFTVLNTDAKGPMISLVTALEEDAPWHYGSSYAFAAVAWIPRTFWPDRPNDLAHDFALEYIPNWKPGDGLGYSLLAEAHLNFGFVGAFLQYFLIAFVLGKIWQSLYRVLAAHGAECYWRVFLAVTYFEIVAIMHRVPSSFILQSCIFELLIPVAAFCALDVRRNTKHAARTSTRTVSRPASWKGPRLPQKIETIRSIR